MAKKRTLDIEGLLFDTELIQTLSLKGVLLYEVMWGAAEDWGGLEMKSSDLKLRMGAIKVTVKEVEKELHKLVNKLKKIIPYQINGKQYGWLKNFLKNQHLNNPALPTLPIPEWIEYEIKEYPSGKKYALFQVITEKLPVDYSYTTSNTETNRNHKKPKETREVSLFWEYYLLKTKKAFVLTNECRVLIQRALARYPLDRLKTAVDNFIDDGWHTQTGHLDLIYCIGKQRGKRDNLDYWVNYKHKKPEVVYG